MCDDLVAKHYLHSAPSHIQHRAPSGVTHFTLHPSKQVWVISHPSSTATPSELFNLRPRWTTINSYDPAFPTWAEEQGYHLHNLREMKLSVPSPAPAEEELPAGFRQAPALSTKEWFLSSFPSRANIVHKGGEQVFSILDASRSIPKRVAWITVLPDVDSKRCYISSLEVAEAHRRKGLARWLVKTVIRWWANAMPEGEVWLTAFEENEPALRLYEGLGFEAVKPLWVGKRKVRRESDANAEPLR